MQTRRHTADIPFTDCPVGVGNYDSRREVRKPIDLIVLHTEVGFKTGTRQTFKVYNANDPSSAHYAVNMDGTLDWFVDEDLVAYHAGNWDINTRSIGIEHEDFAKPDDPRSDALYETSAKLVADICKFYNIPIDNTHIVKHNSVSRTLCPHNLDTERIIRRAKEITTIPASTNSNTSMAKVMSPNGVNVRNTPNLTGQVLGLVKFGQEIAVDGESRGSNVNGNDLWYKVAGKQAFVWSGGVKLSTPVVPAEPKQPEAPIQVTPVQARAAKVLTEAITKPEIHEENGSRFGNEESLARTLVSTWPSYLKLQIDYKKKESILDKISTLIGVKY